MSWATRRSSRELWLSPAHLSDRHSPGAQVVGAKSKKRAAKVRKQKSMLHSLVVPLGEAAVASSLCVAMESCSF